MTHATAVASAAVGFFLEPIPAVDDLLVIAMQYALAGSIAVARGRSPLKVPWGKVSLVIWGGAALRVLPETFLRPIPPAGPIVNALLMAASTELVGHIVERDLADK
jgi:uncharacterized protein (DUF697 family)